MACSSRSGRTVLKCTLPGVPDFYQGTALWDFSLVDPDNRRPVDYSERMGMVAAETPLRDLLADWQSGAIKLRVSGDLLRERRDNAFFYAKADYTPLTVTGGKWSKLIAFVRRFGSERLVVIVPRLSGSGSAASTDAGGGPPTGARRRSTCRAGRWHDVFEGRTDRVDRRGWRPVPSSKLSPSR